MRAQPSRSVRRRPPEPRARALRSLIFVVISTLCVLSTKGSETQAQFVEDPESLETSRGLALGTGMRAAAVSTSALAYNPANMVLGGLYHIEGFAGFEPRVGRWILGASVVDSMTSRLAMGFSFRGILSDGDQGYSGFDGKLALAFPLLDMVSVGLAGRYMSLAYEGPSVGSLKNGDTRAQHFTMDGAVRIAPMQGLNIAALAYNFIDSKSDLVPILLGGGLSYSTEGGLSVGGDVLVDASTYDEAKIIAGGGVELLAAGQIPLRVGYRFDQGREQHAVSGGVGFVTQQLGVEFALQQVVKPTPGTKANTEMMVSFRYFVQ